MPDDVPTYGYLYASAVPTDFRSNATAYYYDSIDTKQDVFQFSFAGHSGKFFIGKNGQVVVVPSSKIRVIPIYRSPDMPLPDQTLKSFRIIAEDGVKYDFEATESTSMALTGTGFAPMPSAYYGKHYVTSWHLTRIVSPFSGDTITLNYTSNSISFGFTLPKVTFIKNSDGTRGGPTYAPGVGMGNTLKLESVELPDNTKVKLVYSHADKYSGDDYALSKIKIEDTVFRYGYLLSYQNSYSTGYGGGRGGMTYTISDSTRLLLKSVTPYTAKEKQDSYQFDYHYPLFPRLGYVDDSIQNKRDHWGYFNGANNGDSLIPHVDGFGGGADRSPSWVHAIANSLYMVYYPGTGSVSYSYELNDHYPFNKVSNQVTVSAPTTGAQNTISLSQVFNDKHQFVFLLDKSVSRSGSVPISGSGNLNVYLKSTDGSVTYLSTSVSLYDLFYTGMQSWTFNLPTGSYRLETAASSGTSVSGSFPITINWENKITDTSQTVHYSGGLRVVSTSSASGIEEYRYITEDGKSSGFMGDVPKYDYPYREVVNYGGVTTTDFTAVSSEPVSTMDFSGGGRVGYSRVEVIRRSYVDASTTGKVVQEFTTMKDVNSNLFTTSFPYTPQDLRDWGLGMPKRISVYDSSGNLVKRTANIYQYDTFFYNTDNFKSLQLGHSETYYNGDRNNSATPKTKTYLGEHFYVAGGRAYLVSSADTIFYPNGSYNAGWQQLEYDTNFNVKKATTIHDRTRGLYKEQRMYYPYNYTLGGGIGKLRDSLILTQPVSTETWITGDGNTRIVSAAATSYRQVANNEIKPDTIYSFESNKPISSVSWGSFSAGKVNQNSTYGKPKVYFSGYDGKGNLTETKNLVTGQYSSILNDYDQQYPVAKVSNAAQADIAYTSFESTSDGNWTVGSTTRDASYKMTGKRSYNLSNGNVSKSGLTSGKEYLLTLWVKSGASVSVNSTAVSGPIAAQQGWNLYSVPLTGITSVTISGSGLIDEVRLHPKQANMLTSNFEPMIGVISTTDANNTVSYTEYDNLNRVYLLRDKDKNIVKRFQYSDSAMLINLAGNWQGYGVQCRSGNPGIVDSIFLDANPFSDSSGMIMPLVELPGYNCSCPGVSSLPQFKEINGVCELGLLRVVSSVRKKIDDVFVWECTTKYCFSDNTYSTWNSISYHEESCAILVCAEL
jgi:hypothetical protein